MTQSEARERILSATTALLMQEDSDPEHITIREIARQAGVGIGLINYHFQSKENLLKQAIDSLTGTIADQWQAMLDPTLSDPVQRLKALLKANAAVGVDNIRLARLSILSELLYGDLEVPLIILPVLKEIFGRGTDDQEIRVIAFMLVTSLQVMLVRERTFRKYAGINIYDPQQREHLIDFIVDHLMVYAEKP